MKIESMLLNALFALLLCTVSFNAKASTIDVTISWEDVLYADQYKLLEKKPDSTTFEAVYLGSDLTVTLEGRGAGEHTYRLYSCVEQQTESGTNVLCEDVSEFAEATANLGESQKRRVIFIHTDLLGSPASETNAAGGLNQ